MEMIARPINFTQKQYEALREHKEETGLSMAAIVRLAVNRYFKEAS